MAMAPRIKTVSMGARMRVVRYLCLGIRGSLMTLCIEGRGAFTEPPLVLVETPRATVMVRQSSAHLHVVRLWGTL
jgi:hypothetical protein